MTFATSPTNGQTQTDASTEEWVSQNGIWIKQASASAVSYYSVMGYTSTTGLPTTFSTFYIVNDLVTPQATYVWDQNASAYVVYNTNNVIMPTASANNAITGAALQFSADGKRAFVSPNIGNNTNMNHYTLTTAFDITTMTLAGTYTTPASLWHFCFNADGTKYYHKSWQTGSADEYDLGTAYDVDSRGAIVASVANPSGNGNGIRFNSDGTRFYINSASSLTLYSYTCATAYSLATAVADQNQATGVGSAGNIVSLSPDGLIAYSSTDTTMHKNTLGTAFDLSTMGAVSNVTTTWNGYGVTSRFRDIQQINGVTYLINDNQGMFQIVTDPPA